MSLFRTVDAARARLLESATPCDNRDIATPDAEPGPEAVAMSQKSQGGASAEPAEPVAMSQMSQQGTASCESEAERWRDLFEERAAIREHDGGLSRTDAEAEALADLARRWRSENPLPASDSTACAHCGKRGPDTPVLARGGHAWLHKACWGPMDAARQREALAKLQALLGAAP
jgi:hypothetical protein